MARPVSPSDACDDVSERLEGAWTCANNEILCCDSTAHVAVDHEGQSTEHLRYLVFALE